MLRQHLQSMYHYALCLISLSVNQCPSSLKMALGSELLSVQVLPQGWMCGTACRPFCIPRKHIGDGLWPFTTFVSASPCY